MKKVSFVNIIKVRLKALFSISFFIQFINVISIEH